MTTTIVFDKTGTLTIGKPSVTGFYIHQTQKGPHSDRDRRIP